MIGWNNWNQSSQYCAYTNNNIISTGGGDWWEYEFTELVDISMIEIFGRIDCCPERIKNVRIELFNDKESRTKVIWTGSFGDINKTAHKAIKLE